MEPSKYIATTLTASNAHDVDLRVTPHDFVPSVEAPICGKCPDCSANQAFQASTGRDGTRLCRESVKNAKLSILGYNIEYRRARVKLNADVGQLSTRQQAFRNKRLALLDARRLVKKHTAEVEGVQHRRETLLKMLEDPQETLVAQGQKFFDTDVIHGTPQRVQPGQLFDMVEPLVNHSSTQLNYALNADRMVYRLLMQVAGSEITRVARGFLWRVRVAEFRHLYLQNVAAITIQSLWRGLFVRKYIVPLFRAQRSTRCAIVIQRITRGWLKRLWYQRVMQHRRQLLEAAAAVRIQATVRGWTIYKDRDDIWEDANDEKAQWDEYRQIRLERARKRRWKTENEAASNIQRMVRGLLARRESYMRRQQGFISHPRVRELADAYLSGGDLWGLLATINMDYERRDTSVRNDQVQMDAFIKQMQRLREEKSDFDPSAWEEAKQQLGLSALQPQTQTMDAKLAIMEQLYLPGKARSIPDSRSGTRFVVQQESNRYIQSAARNPAQVSKPTQNSKTTSRSGRSKPQARHNSITARGPEDVGVFAVQSSSAVLQQHKYTAGKQPMHQPIDGSHPIDEYIPQELTAALAIRPNALGETPEEMRSKIQPMSSSSVKAAATLERSFTLPSVAQPVLHAPKTVREAAFLSAGSLLEQFDGQTRQGQPELAPYHSGRITTWNRPLIPGGSLVGEDGYFRAAVMSAALSQIDRLASKAMIQAATEDDGRPVSPATMLLLRVKSKKQEADRENFKLRNRQLFKEESKHLDGPDQTYEDADGNRMAVSEADLVIHASDTPRAVVSKKMKKLAMESAAKSSAAGTKEARGAAQSDTGGLSTPPTQTRTYRQVKYEAILHSARTAAAGLVSAIAETVDSMIIRERMDERTAEAIASGTTSVGAGPEGFSRLAASGIMNSVSLGALSRATSRATTPAHSSRPGSQAVARPVAALTSTASSQGRQSATSHAQLHQASSMVGAKPHIKREGTVAAKTFSEITKMGYHVLHGRSEISNPAGTQVQAQLEDAERVADARRKAKANVRKERYYSALADQHEGGQHLASLFGVSTGSLVDSGDAAPEGEFNDEPLAVHNGVRLGDGVEEAIRKEQLVQAYTSGGMPNVHSLLRDVRGMKGPLDALVVHAVLRSIPVPKGVIKWAQRAQVCLSTEIVKLAEGGKTLITDTSTGDAGRVGESSKAHVSADELQTPKVGEEAAKIFADMPAGMVKVQWERAIRETAAPIVAILAHHGCETAGDVQNIDIQKLRIDHSIGTTIKRLLHILRASQKLSSAGVVREVFASAPPPVQPPLIGPYSALHQQGQVRVTERNSFLQKPGAEGEFDVNQSSSMVFGQPVSYDPPGGSRLLGLNLDAISAQSHRKMDKQLHRSSSVLSARITPRAEPPRQPAPAVVLGSKSGGIVSGDASTQRRPIAVVQTLQTSKRLHVTASEPSASQTLGRPRGSSSTLEDVAQLRQPTLDAISVNKQESFFVQAGLYTGFGAGYTESGKCVSGAELHGLLSSGPRLQSSAVSESELLRNMHEQQAREKSSHMSKFFKQPIESGVQSRGAGVLRQNLDQKVEKMRLPEGFSVLERDEALSAPVLRKTMEKREHIVDFQAEVQQLMGSQLGKGLAYTRRKQEIDAQKRAEELREARKESEETLQEAKRTAFQIYYEDKLGGSNVPASTLSGVQQEAEARKRAESNISELLVDMEKQLNGLSCVTDLDSSIDPALIQVAFTLPIPSPRLVAMADYRTQANRTETERLKVLVPYNLFLRQLIAYHLPAQDSRKMDDVSGTKKQRMLIKERTQSASIVARCWTAALQRWGYNRIGQLIGVPRSEMVRVLSSAHPIKRSPGMNRLEKACTDVCACLLPANVALSLESSLQHWQHMSPSTFRIVRQSWASFDRRFQKGPNDINGRPEVGRKLAAERRQTRQLKSANWSTFSKSYDSASRELYNTSRPLSLPAITSVADSIVDTFDSTGGATAERKPLLSPLWFAGNTLDPKQKGFNAMNRTGLGDGTAAFLVDFVADDVEEKRVARNVKASAGGMTLSREKFMTGAPTVPSPIDSTVKYVKSSQYAAAERDSLGLTAAGAVPMEWQHSIQTSQD